jgi:hypothetical protein
MRLCMDTPVELKYEPALQSVQEVAPVTRGKAGIRASVHLSMHLVKLCTTS